MESVGVLPLQMQQFPRTLTTRTWRAVTEYSPGLRDASWQHWSGYFCAVFPEKMDESEVLSGRTCSQGLNLEAFAGVEVISEELVWSLDKEGAERPSRLIFESVLQPSSDHLYCNYEMHLETLENTYDQRTMIWIAFARFDETFNLTKSFIECDI